MTSGVKRQRKKLAPDPGVHNALLDAATDVLREEGVRGLAVAQVLDRAQLSTRAFYRHFDSKDALVSAVFLEMARVETRRLKRKMAAAADPSEAVVAWIDGRLDLAFNDRIRSDPSNVAGAQTQMFAAPELVGDAQRSSSLLSNSWRVESAGTFPDIDPTADALSIHGAIWASVERQWATGECDRGAVRDQVVRFCLRGLGVMLADGR
jgi:AcrR family transcriptional regulator